MRSPACSPSTQAAVRGGCLEGRSPGTLHGEVMRSCFCRRTTWVHRCEWPAEMSRDVSGALGGWSRTGAALMPACSGEDGRLALGCLPPSKVRVRGTFWRAGGALGGRRAKACSAAGRGRGAGHAAARGGHSEPSCGITGAGLFRQGALSPANAVLGRETDARAAVAVAAPPLAPAAATKRQQHTSPPCPTLSRRMPSLPVEKSASSTGLPLGALISLQARLVMTGLGLAASLAPCSCSKVSTPQNLMRPAELAAASREPEGSSAAAVHSPAMHWGTHSTGDPSAQLYPSSRLSSVRASTCRPLGRRCRCSTRLRPGTATCSTCCRLARR
jgi:hypothetical protein